MRTSSRFAEQSWTALLTIPFGLDAKARLLALEAPQRSLLAARA